MNTKPPPALVVPGLLLVLGGLALLEPVAGAGIARSRPGEPVGELE